MEIDPGDIELARSRVNTPIKSQGGSVETDPGDTVSQEHSQQPYQERGRFCGDRSRGHRASHEKPNQEPGRSHGDRSMGYRVGQEPSQ